MSNKNQNIATPQVEEGGAKSETPTKVVQMENQIMTVSQMLAISSEFTSNCKKLESLCSRRELFNEIFFGTGNQDPKELESIILVPQGASAHRDSEVFKLSNPDTLLKIRAIVTNDLADRIEELEKKIVAFRI